jgi:hypothetical protein
MTDTACAEADCSRASHTRGLCQKHYRRLRRHGTSEDDRSTASGFTTWQIRQFHKKIDRREPTECWPWTGNVDRNGYGVWAYGWHDIAMAHRAAWSIANNQAIPQGLEIDHVLARGCIRRDCCNPAHLEAVTHEENMARIPHERRGLRGKTGAMQ